MSSIDIKICNFVKHCGETYMIYMLKTKMGSLKYNNINSDNNSNETLY